MYIHHIYYDAKHSNLMLLQCVPNCYARIMSFGDEESRIVLIAKTNVSAGEELTCDLFPDLFLFSSLSLLLVYALTFQFGLVKE